MNSYTTGVVALLCCTALFAGGIAAADGSYDISIAGSVDTPDRVVTLEGTDYTVSAIGVVDPGEPIQVSVDAPADTTYDLYLYNEEKQQEDRIDDAGASATFDGNYPAGSYVVGVYADGNFEAVHPVVVRSYDVTLETPASAETGETVEFTADVENVAGTEQDLDTVQIVVSKDGDEQVLTATKSADGTYTATTTLSETGEYLVYANARSADSVNGQKELIGVSRSSEITVQEPTATATATATTTATPTSTPDNGGEQDPPTATSTATPTPSDASTASDTPTPTATATPTAQQTPTATGTATPTADSVLTPNGSSPTTTTGRLSVLVPLGALVGFGLFARRRR